MDDRKCFKCGKSGHLKKDCPSEAKQGKHMKCFGCGRRGHMMKDCTTHASSKSESPSNEKRAGPLKAAEYPYCNTTFVDTHCHLEYVFERMRFTGSFAKFKTKFNFPDKFEGCVTTFCDPAAFSSFGLWEDLISQNNVWGTFGCHPHNAQYYNETLEAKIIQCLEHPKAIALGEIGLDYSKRSESKPEIQQEVLKKQASWAVTLGKPIVIHCRDAEDDVFKILQDTVPLDWKIHLHCYTGSSSFALKFLQTFKNLYIGITGVVTFAKANDARELAFDIPLDRLLLETDAPYFVPVEVAKDNKWSHPGMVIYVAKKIAEIKKISIDEVLEAARANTKVMYNI